MYKLTPDVKISSGSKPCLFFLVEPATKSEKKTILAPKRKWRLEINADGHFFFFLAPKVFIDI
jgi:hypothetical protein